MTSLRDRYLHQSDPVSSERRVELVLLILTALLVLQILWGLYRVIAPGVMDPVSPTPESMQVAALEGVERVAPDDREEIRRRPLFWASREPLSPLPVQEVVEAEPAEQSAKSLKGVRMTGVFGAGDDAGIIVISNGKKRRLMVGQDIDGWKLTAVEPTEALLESGAEQTSLSLERTVLAAAPPPSKNADKGGKGSKANNKKIEAAQKAPEGLGLGGGDRDRSKINK